jgi:hypothetical protein
MSGDAVAIVIEGVELREVGGEGTTVLEKNARLVVHASASPRLVVGKTSVELRKGAASFTRLGDREYRFPTDDVMTYLFVELPKDLPEVQYAAVASVLAALSEGRPVPTAAVAEGNEAAAAGAAAPAAAAAAAAGDAAAPAAGPGAPAAAGGFGAVFGALAAKAVHDTKALGEAIRDKAEHDLKLYQEGQAKSKHQRQVEKGGAPA